MSESKKPAIGSIPWFDLTVADAPAVRDFYCAVVGWEPGEVRMGDYADFLMSAPGGGEPVAGICHARGVNAGLPAQWILYIMVADLAVCVARCVEHGGAVIAGPKDMGGQGRYCVIRDPAGAVAALVQPPA